MKTAASIIAITTMFMAAPAYAMPTDENEKANFENPTAEDAENFVDLDRRQNV